jgi:hypothetical protein
MQIEAGRIGDAIVYPGAKRRAETSDFAVVRRGGAGAQAPKKSGRVFWCRDIPRIIYTWSAAIKLFSEKEQP